MKHSESIAKLAAALAKAQAEVEGATKDSKNPHFGSNYADLASVRDASLPHLNKFGLSVVQLPFTEGAVVRLETVLLHESGEWLTGDPLGAQGRDAGPQTVGSCITYLRRQALAAIAGVAPVDDDAEAATVRQGNETREVRSAPAPVDAAAINAAVAEGFNKGSRFSQPVKPAGKHSRYAPGGTQPPKNDAPPLTDSDIPFDSGRSR